MQKTLMIETVNYITGMKKNIQINGNQVEIKAYSDVLIASRKLYEGLHRKNISLKEIESLVENKKKLASAYFNIFNVAWPF